MNKKERYRRIARDCIAASASIPPEIAAKLETICIETSWKPAGVCIDECSDAWINKFSDVESSRDPAITWINDFL